MKAQQTRQPSTARHGPTATASQTRTGHAPRTRDELEAIRSATGRTRQQMIDRFHERRTKLYRRWALGLCKNYAIPKNLVDDVTQEVAIYAMKVVDTWSPEFGDKWEGMMWSRLVPHIRGLVDNGTFAGGMTGMSTWHRRHRKLVAVEQELEGELGRAPTPQEIVDRHNQGVSRTWSDPSRSGMIATIDDLQTTLAHASTDEHPFLADGPEHDHPDFGENSIIDISESGAIRDLIFKACDQIDPDLRVVAETWLGEALDETIAPLSRKQVAAQLGVTTRQVAEMTRRIRQVAAKVLLDGYGVSVDEWLTASPDGLAEKKLSLPRSEKGGTVSERTVWRLPDGTIHRTDGPAIEWRSGTLEWWQNGKRHRTDGPAVTYSNGTERWFTDGVEQI